MSQQPAFGAWIHEHHHARRSDAPSGTALAMERGCAASGYTRPCRSLDARGAFPARTRSASTPRRRRSRCTHQARDRGAFAHGALVAARWSGRTGWYSMTDV
jgi:4-hydroxy-tetrahydrodipicolinate reductase